MKTVLQNVVESCTVVQRTIDRCKFFINKYLRRIVNIHWPEKITNEELWRKTVKELVIEKLRRKLTELAWTHAEKK